MTTKATNFHLSFVLINKLFALFKSKEYFGKKVLVKGWYKRSPVPYIEVYTMTIDGKVKRCYSYGFFKFIYLIFLAFFLIVLFVGVAALFM